MPAHFAPPDFDRHADTGVEWPTWLVCLAIYGGWLGALYWYRQDATAWALVLIVVLAAWYMSLQHELVHGHPTQYAWLNRALGLLPIAVWYPFDIYRSSHLAHHRDEVLTYPGQDPESNYLDPQDFADRSAPMRLLLAAQRTALGRFCITPTIFKSLFIGSCAFGTIQTLFGNRRISAGILLAEFKTPWNFLAETDFRAARLARGEVNSSSNSLMWT